MPHHMPAMNTTVIGRLNPITKIVAVFSLGLSALAWPDFTLGLIVVALLFVVSFMAHIQKDFAKIMFGFGIPVTVMLMFIQGMYSPKNKTVLLDLGFSQLCLEGVLYAAKVVVSLLVFLGSFYIMNKTTYVGSMVAALTAVGLNAKVGYLVLASLNVVPQMQRRMAVIQEAQSARGLDATGGMLSRIKAYIPLLGPVVLSSLTDAQERGMTLETRGFGITGVRQTSYVKVDWNTMDTVANWVLGIVLLAVVVVSILMRIGVIPMLITWGGV
ncbi:energy-coupling factor transporter transmembrane protein EcfT [Bifidobacterium sp. LC6]|uniref:Energy-coupling factor transporter transmembrane protein EcfT n=1 Tax=Bifidobacterium colobi TaxID=2809026 RepID=A0ABS5UVD0_9BIFI|nr:energy-coupling factor transporter transmembrane component T [Bifidobacterium colobi]MBT1175017.1 energy-coupling factor transporter transmembrane protein EcfT [Bifidobacterium colobi]